MEHAKTQKLTAARKRAMFKSRFGEVLIRHGFQYRRNRFIRFHRGQVLLQVGMELSRTGDADIRFGAAPLCVRGIDLSLLFGERISDFEGPHNPSDSADASAFEKWLNSRAAYFERQLLEPFAEIDDISTLLHYQERILEDGFSLMPADWAAWECVFLRDYEKAERYGRLWHVLAEGDALQRQENDRAAVMNRDLSMRDRALHQRCIDYACKFRRHGVYEAQRLLHLLELGAYPLLHERIELNIRAANAAFDQIYPANDKE